MPFQFHKFVCLYGCFVAYSLVAYSLGFTLSAVAAEKQPSEYILTTATTGGTYYPVGVAIATLSKVRLASKQHLTLTARSSAGSEQNLQLLRDNKAQFALLQGLYAAWAWKGKGKLAALGAHKNLRAITSLWHNVEHFVVLSEFAKTGNIDDLRDFKQAKFSIGEHNSGAEGSGRYILDSLNIDVSAHFELVHLGYGASADALQSERIKGMNISGGIPVNALTRAFKKLGNRLQVLEFTDAQLERINQCFDLWSRYEIPANTYPKQPQAIHSIAQPSMLVVREDVSAEHVYLLTKLIFENLDFLNGIHQATEAMSLENALAHVPMPLHPGAVRYYQEQGLDIPQNLLSEGFAEE